MAYRPPDRKTQRGFVLPLTLIMLAVLVALAMGLSRMAGGEVRLVTWHARSLDGELRFRDAVDEAAFRLLTERPGARAFGEGEAMLPIDGSPVRLAGLSCRVFDTAGLFSLQLHDERRLRLLLSRFMPARRARALAARIEDWADADSRRRPHGMEAADYLAAGLHVRPPNRPLRTLDELLLIPGMTPALYNGDWARDRPGLRDLLAAGGPGWFNAGAAPAPVLAARLGVSDARAKAIVRAREHGEWARFQRLLNSGEVQYWEVPPDRPSFKFRLICQVRPGRFARAQIALKPQGEAPYFIELWQYPGHDRH